MLHADSLRPAPHDLDERFLARAERLVRRDRTVHLHGQLFEAPAWCIDRRVELRFDPARVEVREVYLYDKGVRTETLRRLDVHINTRVRRDDLPPEDPKPSAPSTGLNYAELVLERHRALLDTPGVAAPGVKP
jgi:hypothetical protein